MLGLLGVAGAEAQSGVGAGVGGGGAAEPGDRLGSSLFHQLREALPVVAELVPGELPDIGAELLVEELLQLERAAPLGDVRRVERRLGVALLQRGDDRGRVADSLSVDAEHGEGVVGAAGEPEGDRHVGAGDGRVAAMLDFLPGQRPARLLAVVRDVDLPEGGEGVTHSLNDPICGSIGTMAPLGDSEIEARLAEHPGWEREGAAIRKSFKRGDFVGSVNFVQSLVEPAEAMNHHPDLEISWDTVPSPSPPTPRAASPPPTSSWRQRSTRWPEALPPSLPLPGGR